MASIMEIEQRLSQIKSILNKKRNKIDQEMYDLIDERRILNRKVSLLKGEETAIPIKTTFPQDVGAPLPHVVSNGYKTYLLYYIGTSNPDWDESTNIIHVLDPQSKDYVALIQFERCYSIRFGGVNDEVLHGHPLYEHGLEGYEMHEIKNSSWINEQKKINSVHSNFKQELWDARKHYIFTFHDDIFECIANEYVVQVFRGKLSSVMLLANELLFSD